MDIRFRDFFIERYRQYFNQAELPITFEYTDDERGVKLAKPTVETRCFIAALQSVREGHSLRFDAHSIGCAGGRYYCGFSPRLRTGIAEFLSHDEHGEGERYKKTPEMAAEVIRQTPWREAPAAYLLAKRWDRLGESDQPQVVAFFAVPDVLSGLFTLAGFDEADRDASVTAPFSAGCGSIVLAPFAERRSDHPRAVLGMFDVSARPYVPAHTLTLAIPLQKFRTMVENMDESFLITESWRKVQGRI
ncbi:MAG: DUF169 domain-containing protein [Calditrichota bacterium]